MRECKKYQELDFEFIIYKSAHRDTNKKAYGVIQQIYLIKTFNLNQHI